MRHVRQVDEKARPHAEPAALFAVPIDPNFPVYRPIPAAEPRDNLQLMRADVRFTIASYQLDTLPFVVNMGHLFLCALDRHCVQRRFKGNEEHARDGACTEGLVWSFGGTVRISPRFENRRLLAVVGDMKLACYQHHALCRSVPMQRDGRFGGHFEEHVDVVFCGVTMKNDDAASFGQKRGAGLPLQIRITGSPRQCLFLRRHLCIGE